MFTLRRIYNSNSSAPEPCRMPTSSTAEYKLGSALVLTQGKLANAAATDKPLYIAAESAAAGEKKSLICYPISPDMLFEVPVSGVPLTLKLGDKVTLNVTDGIASGVTNTTASGVCTVVDTRGAKKSGDSIFVRIQ